MFRRKKPGTAEPTPPSGSVRPEESVLDELSRAFGQPESSESPARSSGDDATAPSDADPLAAATELKIVTELDSSTDLELDTVADAPRVDERVDERFYDGSADVRIIGPAPKPQREPHPDREPHHVDEPESGPESHPGDESQRDVDANASTRATPRTTISIGDEEVVEGVVDPVSLDEALGRPGDLAGPGRRLGRVSDPEPDPEPEVADASPDRVDPLMGTASTGRSIISIGDDFELPDAVYLDEELGDGESTGADGTVFIDDDGTGDAIAPKDATAQGIEPRIRQRRIGVRRAAGRRRLKWVLLGVFVVILVIGGLTVLGSGLFAIDDVSVGGNVYTDQERLDAVVDELMGTPVLLADVEQAEADLEAIPWVEDARVRTKFPDRATIEIRERSPVATMRGADGLFRVLDADGRVLDVIEGQPVAYVLIAGSGTLDLAAGEFATIGQSSAAALVTKLTPTVRPRVETIEVTPDGSELLVYLAPAEGDEQTDWIRVRFGSAIGDSDQIEKLVRLEKKLDDLPEGIVTEIDVSTDEVTVR